MKFLRLILPFLFACGLHAQTTLFTNINVNGTETIPSAGNLSLLSGSTFTFQIAGTTNSLLYITNGSGNVGALGLGDGLSVSGGNLVAGSSTSANPSAKVSTSVVNGAASTFMRSDAAPAIDLTMAPTWTGEHLFQNMSAITSGSDWGVQVEPILNQRNAANFSALLVNEWITQAGTGSQFLLELATSNGSGGSKVDQFTIDTGGNLKLGTWEGDAVGSIYGGTGLSSFAQGSLLMASAANTWSALADGTVNYVLTASGAGVAPSYQGITTVLDTMGSPAQGDILERGSSAWQYIAPGSTSGYALCTNGTGADPSYQAVALAVSGTTANDVVSFSNTTGGQADSGFANVGTTSSSPTFKITHTDNDTNGALSVINNTNATSYAYGITAYAPSLGAAGVLIDGIGVNSSSGNLGYWGLNYTSSGSASNYIEWGFTGHTGLLKLLQTGILNAAGFNGTLGATTPATVSATTITTSGKVTSYNGISSAGWGIAEIVGYGRATAQTAANAAVANYNTTVADGSYEVSANVNVTTSTLFNFTVTCTYVDEGGTTRTLTMGFTQLAGATLLSNITNATGAGPYEGIVYHIRAQNASAITIATVGTFTTVTYNVEGVIKRTD